ncbi:MAG: MATE family efflux transporter [Bacteroidales bacterium]|nr:MATE family efflux transporter [Bacteroidales bacterium]
MSQSIKNTTYSYRNIWKVAYPILISLVMEQMIGLTDTAFLGRVGEIELGASAIAIIYYMVLFMIGFGFSLGAQIIIGRRNGEGEYRQTGKVFWNGLYFVLGLSGVIILLSELFSPALMRLMVSSDSIYGAALSYVRWRLPGMVFAFITSMYRAFYIGTTQTKTLTLNSIVMVISNVVFNWILIFGKFGLPALGITGAAIGSSLAELVSLIFFVVYTRLRCDREKYGLDRPAKLDLAELKGMMPVCSWTMIQNVISISTWFIFFLYIEHLGERALAISNITRSVSGLLWVVLQAFASTCSTLVSNIIGEGHQDMVPSLIKRIMKMSYGIISLMVIIFCCFPHVIARIYTDIPELIDASIPALIVMLTSYFINVGAMVMFQAVSGTGSTKTAFWLELAALVVYMVYCTVLIGIIKADIAVCWTAEHVYAGCMLIISYSYIRSGRWKNRMI